MTPVVEQRRVDEDEQIGRNDPCWCGSGKKFKKCHGAACTVGRCVYGDCAWRSTVAPRLAGR